MSGFVKPTYRQEAGFLLLHADPVVLFATESELSGPRSTVWSILESISARAYLVIGAGWTIESGRYRRGLDALIGQISQRFDHVVTVTSCPTAGEAATLQRDGLGALHCSTNALVRDDFFKPSSTRHPTFDAIYDAQWADYKRHDLAGHVQSLALIPAPTSSPPHCTTDYLQRAHAAVGHATWITSPWGRDRRWLSPQEINAAYSQARVGLCLSREEGAMLASIQYLLAGLPVVTTHNRGGRDEFFDPAYVRWVEDDPEAVAEAVDELIRLALDPWTIRDAALAQVHQHRARLQTWIQQVILAEGGDPGRWGSGWPEGLPHKFREERRLAADVVAEIETGSRRGISRPTSLHSRNRLSAWVHQRLARPADSATGGLGEVTQRKEAGYLSLLHTDPVVLYAWDAELRDPDAALSSVLEAIPKRASYLVLGPSYTPNDRGYTKKLADHLRQFSRRYEHVGVYVNCPTARETDALRRAGVAALHCSTGALTRADFFTPSPGRQPKFDAIYDAKWSDYKRHDLAGCVRSLALIAPPPWRPEEECTAGYFQRAHAAVEHATWISRPWGKNRWLSYGQIDAAYNEARVGLCLSRNEGHMNASIQYLLAGLPVVTTRHIGGRDEFFDPAYVRWVDDDPVAVADAVDELVALDLDPQMIRAATLGKVGEHRARMQTWLQQTILAQDGQLGRWAGEWPAGLPNKFREPMARAADVIAEITQNGQGSSGGPTGHR